MDGTDLSIEDLCPRHVPEIVATDQRSIRPPWSESSFMAEFEAPGSRSWVLLAGGRVVGYIVTRVAGDEAEVLRIAIVPEARRLGYGSRLLTKAMEMLSNQGVKQLYLEVRSSNDAAKRFYGGHGFRVAGNRSRYYADPEEDAIIMRLTLGQ